MEESKGKKSLICVVLGAALSAAIENHKHQYTAGTQIIQSLQELVTYVLDQVGDLMGL